MMTSGDEGYTYGSSFISILSTVKYPKNASPLPVQSLESGIKGILHKLYDLQDSIVNLFNKEKNINIDLTFFPIYSRVATADQLVWQVTATWGPYESNHGEPDLNHIRGTKKNSYYLFDEASDTAETVLNLFDRIADGEARKYTAKTHEDIILSIIDDCIDLRETISYFCSKGHTSIVI